MALLNNKEIRYGGNIEYIEHLTGKTVKSWRNEIAKLSQTIIFTDNTCLELNPYESIDINNLQFKEIPKSICISCGKDAHASYWDFKGWCDKTTKNFWEQVRKVYWHRYLKNK